jgi:diguanylate cyclase (GGDEF)-like protein/PAS domain S-box-containing protein
MEEKAKEQLNEELNFLRARVNELEKAESERKKAEESIYWQNAVLDAINKVFEEALVCETEKDVAQVCLSVAEKLTDSKFGFIGEVNKEGRFDTIAMSDPGWDACKIPKTNAVKMIRNMEIRGIWGKAIKQAKSVIVNDPVSDPESVGVPEGHPEITSFLGVSLRQGNKVFGMIGLANKEGGYSSLDRQSVEALSIAFEEALMHKRLETALRINRASYNTLLNNIPQKIFYKNRDSVYVLCNEAFAKDLNIKPGEIQGKTDYDFFPRKLAEKYINDDRRIMESGAAEDIEEKYVVKGKEIFIRTYKAPLKDEKGETIGIFGIFWDITARKKIEEQLRILNKELLKSNKRLKQIALRDPHTGLYNHRYLGEIIEAEFYRAKRYGHPFSVIMLDIDYFKSINDVYGHQFGDLVLKQFARVLKKMVRRYDVVIRFGGEEFVIVSSGIDKSGALLLAQRLLDAISLYNFGDKKHVVKLKLSIAVTSCPEDRALKAMDLIELADRIIDKVKEHGGDRVYSSEDIRKKKRISLKKKEVTDIKFLRERIEKLTKRANQNLIEAVFAFARTIKLKDRYTGEHTERIVYYATEIARALDLSKEEIELVKQAATLHDLGKIGISDKILLKPARLTKKEFEEIKKHPQIGVDIIRPIQFLHSIIPLILYHHERWDGRGYPKGLKAEEIPVGARIVAIADVYQALISDRPYRPAYNQKEAIKIIKEGAGTQFDPKIVNVFLKVLQRGKSRRF